MHFAGTILHLLLMRDDETDHRENAGIQIGCSIAAEVTMVDAVYMEQTTAVTVEGEMKYEIRLGIGPDIKVF